MSYKGTEGSHDSLEMKGSKQNALQLTTGKAGRQNRQADDRQTGRHGVLDVWSTGLLCACAQCGHKRHPHTGLRPRAGAGSKQAWAQGQLVISVLQEADAQEGDQAAEEDIRHQYAGVGSYGQLVQVQPVDGLLAAGDGAAPVGLPGGSGAGRGWAR